MSVLATMPAPPPLVTGLGAGPAWRWPSQIAISRLRSVVSCFSPTFTSLTNLYETKNSPESVQLLF